MSAPQTAEPYTVDTYAAEFRTGLATLGTYYAGQAARVYAGWQAGVFTTDEWRALFARSLLNGVGDGTGIGDGFATRLLHLAHGRDVLPVGEPIDVPAELARLTLAVDTLAAKIDTAEDPRPRIERLASSEPVNAAQQSAIRVFGKHQVTGWRRGVRPDACELCHWLAKTNLDPLGYVYPTTKLMHKHPGCTCIPIPVTE